MSRNKQIMSLKQKHSDLEHKIAAEAKRPHPDSVHVAELKREKLRIKEQITQTDIL